MSEDYATKADLEAARLELLERIEKVETSLLTAFQVWARRIERGMKIQAVENDSLRGRLDALEDKVFGTSTDA